jgi:hypothetical protein
MFQDERISAYLDGQLPPDERTQFEDELARNGELRQVVEELRGLHDSLQELPRHRLNDDFALHVLRRAERAMLSDPHAVGAGANGSSANVSSANDAHVVRAGAGDSFQDARKSRRPWIWAAIVVAAAIVVMVYNPPPRKPAEVASRDSSPSARKPEDTRLARSLPEGKIADPAAVRDAKQFDEADLYAKYRKSGVATDGERQFRKRVEDGAAESKLNEGLDIAGDGGHRRGGEKDGARSEKASATLQTSPSQETLRDVASGRGVRDNRSAKANGDVAGGGLSPGRDFEFRSNLQQSADAPTNQPAEGRPAGKPESTAGTFDRLATNKGAAPADVRFGDTSNGKGRGGASDRGIAGTSRSSSHERASSGEMFVAEVATEPGVRPEAVQQLLEKNGIALDSSPAANLALISAVLSASKGNASNTTPLNGISDGGSSPANGASLGAAGFGNASRGGASGNGPAAKIAAGTFSAPIADKDNDDAGLPKTVVPSSNYAAGRPNSAPGANSLGLMQGPAGAVHAPNAPAADDGSLEVVYVVGTRKQVMGLFNDLYSHPAQFQPLALSEVNQETAESREADAKPGEDRLSLDDNAGKTEKADKADKAAAKKPAPETGAIPLDRFAGAKNDSSPVADPIVPPAPFAPPAAPSAPAPAVPPASPPAAPLAKIEDNSPSAQDRAIEESGKKPIAAAGGQALAGASAPAGAKETPTKLPAPKPTAAPQSAASEPAASRPAALQPAAQQPQAQKSLRKQHTEPRPVATELATPLPAAIDVAAPVPVIEERHVEQKKAELAARKPEATRLSATAESESLAEPSERTNGSSWAARMALPPDTEEVLRQALAERQNPVTDFGRQLKLREREADSAGKSKLDHGKSADKEKFGGDVQFRQKAAEKQQALQREGAAAEDQVQAVFVFRSARGKASTTAAATASAPAKPVAAPTGVTSSPAARPAVETPSVAPSKSSK